MRHRKGVRRPKHYLAGQQKPAGDRGAAPNSGGGGIAPIPRSPKELRQIEDAAARVPQLCEAPFAGKGIEQDFGNLKLALIGNDGPTRGDEGAVPGGSVGVHPVGHEGKLKAVARNSGPAP